MPPIKQVQSLRCTSGQSLARHFHSLSEAFIRNLISYETFTRSISALKHFLKNKLHLCDPHIATFWLKAADELARRHDYADANFPNSIMPKLPFIVDSLVEVATRFNVERLAINPWSEPVQSSLLKNLHRMKNLKYLSEINIEGPSGWKIINGFSCLTNLTSITDCFSFTDRMIFLLYKYCKRMKTIQLKFPGVTDSSIEYLAQFEELQSLDVVGTNVTSKGLVKFLLTSQSETFAEINVFRTDQFISHLIRDVVPFRTFNIRSLTCSLNSTRLPLIPKYFPSLTKVNLFRYLSIDWSYLSFLTSLEHLEGATVRLCHYKRHLDLSPPRGPVLTQLELFEVFEIDFLELALRLPNLQSILLFGCLFSNVNLQNDTLSTAFKKLKIFQFLYYLDIGENLRPSITGVQYILSRALDIEEFRFRGNVGLSDNFITSVFQTNPLNKLEKLQLYNHDNIHTLKDFIKKCPRLSSVVLSYHFPTDKLEDLSKFVIENNYDINLTLS